MLTPVACGSGRFCVKKLPSENGSFCIFLFAHELAVAHVDLDDVAGGHIACKDRAGNERFDGALEISLERTCAEHRVKAAVDDKLLCGIGDLKAEALVLKALPERRR